MNNFTLVNCDTDSISFCKPDGSEFSESEQELLLVQLNSLFPDLIKWEHDGIYSKIIILKAKNYILHQNGKIKIKGSSLKSSKTEKGLKDFMSEIINCLVYDKQEDIINIYHKYIKEVHSIQDILRWSSKKTITEAVLTSERTNEKNVFNALQGRKVQMGDKYYMYFTQDGTLSLAEDWQVNNPNHDSLVLVEKLYKTLCIFQNVIDITQYPKYHLKKQKDKLAEIVNG